MRNTKKFLWKNIEFLPFNKDFYILHSWAKACIMWWWYGSFMDLLDNPIPAIVVLNHNEKVSVNQTEQYQRFILFQKYLQILLYNETMSTKEVSDFLFTPLESKALEKRKKINTKWAENLRKFFNT